MNELPSDQTTLDLIRRARARDEFAWHDLFAREKRRVVAVLAHYLRGRRNLEDVIDDVCQEIHLLAYRRFASFEENGPGAFGRWLAGIARNKAREYVASAERGLPMSALADTGPSSPAALLTTPSSRAARKELNGALISALDRLPEDHRRVIILRYFELRNGSEIAEELGRNDGAVRALLFRAMAALAAELKHDVTQSTA